MPRGQARLSMVRRTVQRYRRQISLIAAVAGLCACRTENPETAYQRLWSLYTNGALSDAAEAASRKSLEFGKQPESVWFWKFRLLQAEALLAQGRVAEAAVLIKDPIPGRLESNRLELRRLIDQAN